MKTPILCIFFILFVGAFFSSCKEFDQKEFIGKYQLDHPVLLSKINYDFEPVMTIKPDNTFEIEKDIRVKGIWKFVEFKRERAVIKFTYLDKIIFAEFSENIIYFKYPNDFDDGAFESMLYVRLNK